MKTRITLLLLSITLQMSAQCWQSISAGYNHSLAVKNDGTLWAWGSNGTRNLGDGTNIDKIIPTQIGYDTNWLQVCANFSSSFAIKTDGTLWAWGWNGNGGALGLGTTTPLSQSTPIQVGTDTNWQSISSSNDFCIALKTDGTLWAWGKNDHGQLGDNTTIYRNIPTQIGTDTNWQTISAGSSHCMAIKSNGTLWGWGWNSNGKLGDGTNIDRLVPTQIGTATNWHKVDSGYDHSLAIKTDGTLWAWGTNFNGELGMVTQTFISNVPIQIGTASDWQDVSASQWFTYAIKTNKTLWSTGRNEEGQLGNGTSGTTDVLVFTQVGTTSDSNKIATGYFHVLNINQDGFIRVTGKNDKGQLGDGTTTQKNSLTTISCYPTVLSTQDFTINEIKVYPNPVNDILNISLDNEITTVSIYNLLGQEVLSKSINNNEASINIASLPSANYLVKVTSGNQTKTVTIIKK